MRFFCILGVLLFLTSNSFGETTPRVALEARIVSERYCAVDEEFGSLLVKFEVKLTNNGDDPIRINPPFYPVLRVARSVHDLNLNEKKKLEFELHAPDVFFAPPKERTVSIPSSIIVIHPAQTHQSETIETTVPTLRTSGHSKHGGVAPGIHFVQLVIQGDIVGRSAMFKATSQSIKINVEKNPYVVQCD
jgi:hypothetical protein